jgi:hypothetical protein
LKTGFQETTFQTFLCLFAIGKVGQRKILSGQRKILSSQKKIWFGFQENIFLLFWTENISGSCENLEMSYYLLIISIWSSNF